MSKKMIAAIISLTLVFVFVFAACNGNNIFSQEPSTTVNTVYDVANGKPYVTDENGNRVYTPDGEAILYVTNKDGSIVTRADGVPESIAEPFEPISEEGKVEYYGYKVVLPEGWEITDEPNRFINTEAKHYVMISVIDKTYDEYYEAQRNTYDTLIAEDPQCASWAEDVSIGSGCIKVVRFTVRLDNAMNVMYFFENSGNLYKILFQSENADKAIEDSLTFCQAITYKPYLYHPEETTGE